MRTTRAARGSSGARSTAVAGVAVAVGVIALMTAGVAAADVGPGGSGPGGWGHCAEDVDVRAAPITDAPVVAVCGAGTAVTTGRVDDGFVELTDLDGWAVAEHVAVDGRRAGSTPAPRTGPGPAEDPTADPVDGRSGGGGVRPGDRPDPDDPVTDDPVTDDPVTTAEPDGDAGSAGARQRGGTAGGPR